MTNFLIEDEDVKLPILKNVINQHWIQFIPNIEDREEILISVDGGVQNSELAYGYFISVARACALIHVPNQPRKIEKKVKIYIQDIYDNRDRGFVPSYVRMIAEYKVAISAARKVLEKGLKPLVLLDGSLFLSRFPYAIREYYNHSQILVEFFNAISDLRSLAQNHNFSVAAVSKNSSVFYLYMTLFRKALLQATKLKSASVLKDATTPLDLRMRFKRLNEGERRTIESYLSYKPICDTALISKLTNSEGYSTPLILAPSIYFTRDDRQALFNRIRDNISLRDSDIIIQAINKYFEIPPIVLTYWKPTPTTSPFRIDIAGHSLDQHEPHLNLKGNILIEQTSVLKPLERILNHLGHWYCNDIEYNLPLKQADTLAHFDRNLYTTKYEPFIIKRLEEAGLDISGSRRALREV
jgi:hypothetical protein